MFTRSHPSRVQLQKWGVNIDPTCEFCGRPDTTWHRIWVRSHSQEVRGEELGQMTRQAREAGEGHPLFTFGWIAHLDLAQPPMSWDISFFDGTGLACEPFLFGPGARLFSGGSCLHPRFVWSLARA
eukprot:5528682-Pyramimonas_sp.AAC.1